MNDEVLTLYKLVAAASKSKTAWTFPKYESLS